MERWRQKCELMIVVINSRHTNYMSINIHMYKNKNIKGYECIANMKLAYLSETESTTFW